jgi:iron complex outermembrane recepter protein
MKHLSYLFSKTSPFFSFLNFSFSFLPFFFFLLPYICFAQVQDSTKTIQLNDVLVVATRINAKTPLPFSNMSKTEIESRNLGQDIPVLVNFLPSVVTTSDAGNGFGYTGIRVRGSDATRINVTINGIPYNDSESQGTFFVNLPDFASSLQSIQLQRGAGTSTNGSGAFGASLNMQTDNYLEAQNVEISNSIGSFLSYKNTFKYSSGLINNHFEFSGRLSNLHSDGYVDRATSELKSYFFQGNYINKSTLIKALFFGGKEKTYQAWYGLDAAKLSENRTYNYAGLYFDNAGNELFYDNQTDNYQQHHAQLHWNQKLSDNWNTNLAFHYTKGKGYYENYEQTNFPQNFGLTVIAPQPGLGTIDLVNQKWLDNDFYGTTFSANYKKDKTEFILGGSANKYEGKHYNQVIWAKNATTTNADGIYFDDFAVKNDATVYYKINHQIADNLSAYIDLQYRSVNYKTNFVARNYNFFNPKAGLTLKIKDNQNLYFSYSKANREPNRTDFENGNPEPESLDDFEFGIRTISKKTQLNINAFYMNYRNQLVLTGALDNVGNPIRKNMGESYRIGLEVDANIKLSENVSVRPNFTLSENKNKNFVYDRNGLNFTGNTNIAFSPQFIAANSLNFQPTKVLQFSFLTKFVGRQYLSNNEDNQAILKDYLIQDFIAQYQLKRNGTLKNIEFKLLVNNFLDKNYLSNGADYGSGYTYYFPQAGINFMIGTTLKF